MGLYNQVGLEINTMWTFYYNTRPGQYMQYD